MATYFARGGVNDNITTAEKREALAQALKVIGRPLRKVLVLPPDHTRLNSDAGELTRLLYEMLAPKVEVDIMPALGTHSPMTDEEAADDVRRRAFRWTDSRCTTGARASGTSATCPASCSASGRRGAWTTTCASRSAIGCSPDTT